MNDLNLWESKIAAINEFILSYSFETTAPPIMILSFFGLFLVISSQLGFGFFLWHLKNSNEHTQSRLLNILNGYFSAVCMTSSPAVFNTFLQASIIRVLSNNELKKNEYFLMSVRVVFTHLIAVSVLFLLISCATVLNHFKPGLYLDVSLNWRHKIAIPVMIISFILTEQSFHASCDHWDTIFKVWKCKTFRMRTMVMIPATVTSFLCQLIVVVDDIWGWKNIYNALRQFLRPNMVTQINNGDIEMPDLSAAPGPQLYDPSPGLNHHSAEFVSLNTGFLTLCLFNMMVFLISLLTTLFEVFDSIGPGLAWLVAMAVTPTIWIFRSRKMTDKIKKIFL